MIRILTDSTCELSPQRQRELQVEVIPLTVLFGEEAFQDGVDLTNAQFYARLEQAQELPRTTQINPAEFESRFRPYLEQGDEIICLLLSGKLSGTRQSACIARELLESDKIYIPETGTVTFGLGLLVELAARFRDEGCSAPEIVQRLEALLPRMRFYAVFNTLKYLKMGGRISSTTAVVGGMLGVTPIIRVQDGVLESVGKSRGYKGAFQWMEKQLQAEPVDLTLPVAFGHTNAPEAMEACQSYFRPLLPGAELFSAEIGSVVGTHAGPGATGLCYFTREG